MGQDFEITGAEEFQFLSRRLKDAGTKGKGLRKELYTQIRKAAKPLRDEVKKAERADLPHAGGYAAEVARSPITTVPHSTGDSIGVTLKQRGNGKTRDLQAMDDGLIRHPLFGNRDHWYSQDIPKGIWSDTLSNSESVETVRKEIIQAMNKTAKKIGRPH